MNDNAKNMSCLEFQAQLPELIAAGGDLNNHPHYRTCELCSALMADLETIAEAARQLLPADPPDNLWEQIEMAIEKEDQISKEI